MKPLFWPSGGRGPALPERYAKILGASADPAFRPGPEAERNASRRSYQGSPRTSRARR